MTIRDILKGDIPQLREICTPVTDFGDNLEALLADLRDTVQAHRGLGLSAPQIGSSLRVIVIDLGDGIQEYINPEVTAESNWVDGYESCLSFPDHVLKISRPQQISLRAHDRKGCPFDFEASDLMARIICHEVDHLNGVLFMDHLSEEAMFAQLLGNELDLSTVEEEADMEENNESVLAENQELQLAADMLSEISWKLVLTLEILRDYKERFQNDISWKKLKKVDQLLSDTVGVIESHLKES